MYIPLGGNRQGVWRGNLNMLLAMLVSGLWHGASLNFIIWGAARRGAGAVQGLNLRAATTDALAGRGCAGAPADLPLRRLRLIFFRCASLDDALDMLGGIAGLSLGGLLSTTGLLLLGCVLYIAVYPQVLALLRQGFAASSRLPWQLYPIPLGLFVSLVIFASQSGVPGFIYASF
ncbi:hypothetical protein NWF32_09765 [Pseudomonas qingdaonensis]|nr:hypothetical protein [Pseudomonas qingdaonensis]